MRKVIITVMGFYSCCIVPGLTQMAGHSHQSATSTESADAQGKQVMLVGYVRDAFCLLKNRQAGVADDSESRNCMRKCVQRGSPLVLLGKDGTLYLPIASGEPPDMNERQRLLPYVGKTVRINGLAFERGNMHAIAIQQVEVVSP